jgi:hypothetical protein
MKFWHLTYQPAHASIYRAAQAQDASQNPELARSDEHFSMLSGLSVKRLGIPFIIAPMGEFQELLRPFTASTRSLSKLLQIVNPNSSQRPPGQDGDQINRMVDSSKVNK